MNGVAGSQRSRREAKSPATRRRVTSRRTITERRHGRRGKHRIPPTLQSPTGLEGPSWPRSPLRERTMLNGHGCRSFSSPRGCATQRGSASCGRNPQREEQPLLSVYFTHRNTGSRAAQSTNVPPASGFLTARPPSPGGCRPRAREFPGWPFSLHRALAVRYGNQR